MKQKLLTIVSMLLLIMGIFAFTTNNDHPETEDQKAVKQVIINSYVNGAFNGLNPDAMRKGFHPDFAIFSAKGEDIKKYPIAKWADRAAEKKSAPDFDPNKNKWDHKFVFVDVTGGSASVKIELSKDGEHVYTDYLSLLRFDSGWRIVAKVYHSHKK